MTEYPLTIQIAAVRARFDAKWLPDCHFGCWVWVASLSTSGYGHMTMGSRTDGTKRPHSAHRIGYELYIGAIPPGLVTDHLCRNRFCVNPWHLELVTPRENTVRADWAAIVENRIASRTHCPRGHPFSGENLYIRPDGARGCKACMRESNIRCRRKNR